MRRQDYSQLTATEFEDMARLNTDSLIRWVEAGHLSVSALALALEALAKAAPGHSKVQVLLASHRSHVSPIVRRGVIHGLFHSAGQGGALSTLSTLARNDPRPELQLLAAQLVSSATQRAAAAN